VKKLIVPALLTLALALVAVVAVTSDSGGRNSNGPRLRHASAAGRPAQSEGFFVQEP